MMSRFLVALCGLMLAHTAQARLNVLACEPEWGALVTALAGDRATVTVATSATQDPHKVQARPSLISAARRADLAVCNGAELEVGWLPVLLNKGANPKIRTGDGLFYAADHVTLLDIPDKVSRSDGDVHAAGNPHIHLDPRRMIRVAEALTGRLSKLDPDAAELYAGNRDRLTAELNSVIEWAAANAAALNGEPVVVHHTSFRYLADWLGLKTIAMLEAKPGLPPSPRHLGGLVEQVSGSDARLILFTDYNGDKAARWLADRTPLCALSLPFSVGASDDTQTLPELYRSLVTRLLNGMESCSNA